MIFISCIIVLLKNIKRFAFLLDKTFVAVIRYDGVPSSLNVISDKTGNGGRLLQPYPDWSWTNYKDCSGIVSVYKIAVIETFSMNIFRIKFSFERKKIYVFDDV